MFRTCTWTRRSASLLLIQEKQDRGAAESCKSGSTWLETWMSWRFSSQHGLSPKHVSSYMHKPGILSLRWASVLPLIKVAALPRQSRPGVNCRAYPPLAFRRHSKLPESISRFTDLLRSTKTCHKLLTDSTRVPTTSESKTDLSESPTTHPMCTWT